MNSFTHCPSCKHAIFYGYDNGYGCYLTECKYELTELKKKYTGEKEDAKTY